MAASAAQPTLTCTPLQTAPLTAALPQIVWSSGDDAWQHGAPLFSATNIQNGMAAQGWAAATPDALLLLFRVHDTTHMPPPPDAPWDGDGIELCLDARGDGTRNFPSNRPGCYGPDDVKFMATLGTDGPRITRVVAGDGGPVGAPLPDVLRAARDAAQHCTSYELRLPWSLLHTEPGLCPTLGLAVQCNNLEPGMREKEVLQWGGGTFGPFCPGLFNQVLLPAPPGPFCAVAWGDTVLWDAQASATARLAYRAANELVLEAQCGTNATQCRLSAASDVVRLSVLLRPPATDALALPVRLRVRTAGDGACLAERSDTLAFPEARYQALLAQFDALAASAEEPLLRRHLQSCRALLVQEWLRTTLQRAHAPENAERLFADMQRMQAGLAADAGTWAAYRDGKRDLILAYISPTDGTLQYYQLGLPRSWESQRAYPLFFELHGSGDPRPIAGVAAQLAPSGAGSGVIGQSSALTFASVQGRGYHCIPFGRGNLFYRGIAEIDVWEAYDDVHKHFVIDADRRYLYGFSMGGGGTWTLGTRTPDHWAALAILAGGLWREKPGLGLGQNIAHLPVFIWCGERDSLFENVARMRDELTRFGATPVVKTTPELGHMYRGDVQEEVINWLQQFTRTRPANFSFVADTDEHTGTWGISLNRDARVAALPRFTCAISNQVVRIDSSGTAGLEVRAGADGLGLTGIIDIIWNGVPAYQGPATTVQLGQPAWRPQL
jgi:dienelactone hydrolase